MLRKTLDAIYLASGYLAAFFLAAIGLSIVAQIVSRFFGGTLDATEFAGFCLAASSFLGLGYTFKQGSHIRVSLLLTRFEGGKRRLFELWCCIASAVVLGYAAWETVLFTLQSYEFGDLSPGLLAAPFWIPQSGMAIGLVILAIGFIDEAAAIGRGEVPSYEANAETALE